jgi:glycosyltransferase involved in cell wall biosynthesis
VSSSLRILFIAHSFPPSAEVGGRRIAHFCNYLPEFGVQPTILTVQNRFHERLDHTFLVPPAIRVIRTVQHNTPLDWYTGWKSRRSPADSRMSRKNDDEPKAQKTYGAPARRLRQCLLSIFTFPDQYWGWYFPATRTGRHLLQSAEFDAILSTGPPYTAHLIGRSLKAKYQIPWIADFRDPWATNDSLLSSQPKWYRELGVRVEASCVMSADLVICNTDWQHRIMCERYPKLPPRKFVTLTNGFGDVERPPNLELQKHNPLRCLHLGTIYEGRRIDTFCASLSILVKQRKLDPGAVKVLFLGDTDNSHIATCRELASELLDSGMIEFHQHVGKDEARRFLSEADLLLVFQGGYRTQIPFKFYEYFATGKPIFAITQQGALSEMMAQTGVGIWAGEDDPYEIGEKFLLALSLPAQSAEAIQGRWAEQFHFRSLSRQLAKWIRGLVDGQRAD